MNEGTSEVTGGGLFIPDGLVDKIATDIDRENGLFRLRLYSGEEQVFMMVFPLGLAEGIQTTMANTIALSKFDEMPPAQGTA